MRFGMENVISEASVLSEIRRLMSATLKIEREVSACDELINDLDLDSADLITLAIAIERHFKISLPEEDTVSLLTVGDLCRAVTRAAEDRC